MNSMLRFSILASISILLLACSSEDESYKEWSEANKAYQKKHANSSEKIRDEIFGENRALHFALKSSSRLKLTELLKKNHRFVRRNNLSTAMNLAINHGDFALFEQLIRDPKALKVKYRGGKSIVSIFLSYKLKSSKFTQLIVAQLIKEPVKYKRYFLELAFYLVANKRSDSSLLRVLKLAGLKINRRNALGDTLLIAAIRHRNEKAVKQLLSLGVNIYLRDKKEQTALMLAAQLNQVAIFRLLAELGLDPFATRACQFNIQDAVMPQSKLKHQLLKIESKTKCIMNTAMYALQGESSSILIEYFNDKKHFEGLYRSNGDSSLIIAIRQRNTAIIQFLLKLGVNVNAINVTEKQSALSYAFQFPIDDNEYRQKNSENITAYSLADLILKQGAQIDRQSNKQGEVVVLSAIEASVRHCNISVLRYLVMQKDAELIFDHLSRFLLGQDWHASSCDHAESILMFLHKNGLNLSLQQETGKNLLHYAIAAGNFRLTRYLLKMGLRLNSYKLMAEKTILAVILEKIKRKGLGHISEYKIVKQLFDYNLISANSLNQIDEQGKPLFFNFLRPVLQYHESKGEYAQRMKIVDHFLRLGVNLNLRNKFGEQALHYVLAKRGNNYQIVRLLLSNAAPVNTLGRNANSVAHYLLRDGMYGREYFELFSINGLKYDLVNSENQTPLSMVLSYIKISDELIYILRTRVLPYYAKKNIFFRDERYLIEFLKIDRLNDLRLLQLLGSSGMKVRLPNNSYQSIDMMAVNKNLLVKKLLGFFQYHQYKPRHSYNYMIDKYLKMDLPIGKMAQSKIVFYPKIEGISKLTVRFTEQGFAKLELELKLKVTNNKSMSALAKETARLLSLRFFSTETTLLFKAEARDFITWFKQAVQVNSTARDYYYKERGSSSRFKIMLSNRTIKGRTIKSRVSKDLITLTVKYKRKNQSLLIKKNTANKRLFVFEDGDEYYGEYRRHKDKIEPHGKGVCFSFKGNRLCQYDSGRKVAQIEFALKGNRYIGNGLIIHKMFSRELIADGKGLVKTIAGLEYAGHWRQGVLIDFKLNFLNNQAKFVGNNSKRQTMLANNQLGRCFSHSNNFKCRYKFWSILKDGKQGKRKKVFGKMFGRGWLYELLNVNEPEKISSVVWVKLVSTKTERSPIDSIYKGKWKNNRAHGAGLYIDNQFNRYLGSWRKGKRHGEAECLSQYGEKKHCRFYKDFLVIINKFNLSVKKNLLRYEFYQIRNDLDKKKKLVASYIGKLKSGLFSGYGELISKSMKNILGLGNIGDYYYGNFVEGRMQGFGSYFFRVRKAQFGGGLLVSRVIQGKFNDGKWPKFGTVSWYNGFQYLGPLYNGSPHGKGVCREDLSHEVAREISLGKMPPKLEAASSVSCVFRYGRKK